MKTKTFYRSCLCVILILLFSCRITWGVKSDNSGNVFIYSSQNLSKFCQKWINEYNGFAKGSSARSVSLSDKELGKKISSGENLCLVSGDENLPEKQLAGFQLLLGREIIVPVVSRKNPFIRELTTAGLSGQKLNSTASSASTPDYNLLLGNGSASKLSILCLDETSVKSALLRFAPDFGNKPERISYATDRTSFLNRLESDPLSIGFCRLTDIVSAGNAELPADLCFVPIDRNGNGSIDYLEQIYGSVPDFTRAVWIGKYPKSLTNNIYLISKSLPVGVNEISFLEWALTAGQEVLPGEGFSGLAFGERQSQLDKLLTTTIIPQGKPGGYSAAKIILAALACFLVLGFFTDYAIRRKRQKAAGLAASVKGSTALLNEKSLQAPGGIFFDKGHTWAYLEKDGSVRVGIDDFMQHVTGPLTRIMMKESGEKIRKGEPLCTLVRKGKQLILYAPVSGTITEFNSTLSFNPLVLNSSPYNEGWIYRIEPSNWIREMGLLTMGEKYRSWLSSEIRRLKDFLSQALTHGMTELSPVVLQDGGEIRDHILAEMSPEVWEDFQTKFINSSR
jgi:glycine cleavage system H lipoate-binding protein